MTTRGQSTAECLVDYGRRFNVLDGVSVMAEFTGVTPATTLGWMQSNTGEALPKGLSLLKLRCFLSLAGYDVLELDVLPPSARKLAEIIAFDVFTIKNVMNALGYTDDKAIFRQTLQVATGLSAERANRVDAFVQTHEEARKEVEQRWHEKLAERSLLLTSEVPQLQEEVTFSSTVIQVPESVLTNPVLIAFAANGLELTAIALEQLVVEDRVELLSSLRYLVGEERLRCVAEVLTGL